MFGVSVVEVCPHLIIFQQSNNLGDGVRPLIKNVAIICIVYNVMKHVFAGH